MACAVRVDQVEHRGCEGWRARVTITGHRLADRPDRAYVRTNHRPRGAAMTFSRPVALPSQPVSAGRRSGWLFTTRLSSHWPRPRLRLLAAS